MLTVYGRRSSSSVQLVMWAIHELGIEHNRLDYGHGYASTTTNAYLNMNPMGRIPVIEDNGLIMFESAAILRYLGANYGSDEFWPRDPAQRAPLDIWAEWGKNTFTEVVLNIFANEVRTAPNQRDPSVLDAAVTKLIPLAQIINSRLQNNQWIGGDKFTFADIACGHILYRYYELDWQRPHLSALAAYYQRLQKRPAFQNQVMVSFEELRGSY